MSARERSAALVTPALATRVDAVPTGSAWLHEPKIDGYRIQCHVQERRAMLLSRNGLDYTHKFPGVAAAAVALIGERRAILDGEVVVPTADGQSPFQSLQAALRAGTVHNAIFWAFDLLRDGRSDLRAQPLMARRARLEALIGTPKETAVIRITPELTGAPASLLAAACARGEEGVISKRRDAAYFPGRTRDWLKIKCGERDELVIIGYTEPEGSRTHFGALLLASRAQPGAALRYAGRVGTGFSDRVLADLFGRLRRLERDRPSVTVPQAATRGVHWVEPQLVADVAFTEWTVDHLLRHATFQGIRDDKESREVRMESSSDVAGVAISHGARIVYPEIKLTKRGLAEYYEAVAPLMLPHVAARPLSTVRCPDGPQKACFFQKHWKATRGAAVSTVAIDEADGEGGDYAVAQAARDLVALVQWNVIEFHTWGSRTDALEAPDRLILDLDPGPGVGWSAVRQGAVLVHDLLATAGLQSWVKLSGGKGLHVTVPLDRRLSWRQLSDLSKLIAGRLVHDHPHTFVDVAAKAKRQRRIFVDWMRNSRGATAAAPWSVRARKQAPVAVPIDWPDLDQIDGPAVMTVPVVREFLASRPLDPWRTMLSTRQRLTARVLDALTPSDA